MSARVARIVHMVCVALFLLSTALAGLLAIRVAESRRLVDELIREAIGDRRPQSVDSLAMALSDQIYHRTNAGIRADQLPWYERLESTSFFNVTTAVSLKHGIYGVEGHSQYGACGTMSRVLLNALWRLDVPARKLQLLNDERGRWGGHTMVEYHDGRSWKVISPSDSSFVWRRPDGAVAGVDDIRGRPGVFAQIFSRYPHYPYRFFHPSHIRWEKLPAPIVQVARGLLGERAFLSAQTPRLYDMPRALFLLVSLALCAVFGALAVITRRWGRYS